ncbi:15512_t:CDS:2, partial [Dentiscutata heterogama]
EDAWTLPMQRRSTVEEKDGIKPHRIPEEVASSETHSAVRIKWLLDQTKEEEWQNYRATLWKLLDSKIPSFLKEHYIDINIASAPNTLDRVNQVWGLIEEAIIKSAKQNLPNKKIKPSKSAVRNRKRKDLWLTAAQNLGKIMRDIKRADNPPNSCSVLQWNKGLKKINKSTGSEITLVTDFITESWLEEAKVWWKTFEGKVVTEENIRIKKEIRVCVERRAQMIVKEQKRMLTSLLEKSTAKVTIDRVYTEEAESARLETKPKEVLRITKEHFQNQFRKRKTNIALLNGDWHQEYSPIAWIQENWYDSLLEPIELEEWEA